MRPFALLAMTTRNAANPRLSIGCGTNGCRQLPSAIRARHESRQSNSEQRAKPDNAAKQKGCADVHLARAPMARRAECTAGTDHGRFVSPVQQCIDEARARASAPLSRVQRARSSVAPVDGTAHVSRSKNMREEGQNLEHLLEAQT